MNFNANIIFIQFFIIKRLLKIENEMFQFKKLRINREEIDEFNSKINLYL